MRPGTGELLRQVKTNTCHPEKPHWAKGLCSACYQAKRNPPKPLTVNTCHPERPHLAKGLCNACYQTQRYRQSDHTLQWSREWRRKNPEKVKAAGERYRGKYPEKVKAYSEEYHKSGKAREKARERRYGLTAEQVTAMWEAQGCACKMCLVPLEHAKVHVDHCHTTGRVRGLLCLRCNTCLGHLEPRGLGVVGVFAYLGWI